MQRTFYIKSLELTDFMNFEHSIFNFAEDLSLVVGKNGTGKSAILEALALSFQIKERTSGALTDYIRHHKEKAVLKLTCMWLGEELVIETVINATKSKRTQRTVTHHGETYKDTQAGNYLAKFFDNRSLTISFAMQGNERFLTSSRTTNLKNLTDLLQLDFTKELKQVTITTNGLESKKTDALATLNKQTGAKEANTQTVKSYEERLTNLQAKLSTGAPGSDTSSIDSQLVDLNVKLQNLLDIKNGVSQKATAWQNSKQQLDKAVADLQYVEKQITELPTNLVKQDVTTFETLKADLPNQLNALNQELTTCNEHVSTINGNISTITAQRAFELDRQQKLKDGICPTCLQKVTDKVSLDLSSKIQQLEDSLNKYQAELQESNNHKKEIETAIQGKNNEIAVNADNLRKAESNNMQIAHVEQLKNTLTTSKQSLQTQIENLKVTTDELLKAYEQASKVDDTEIAAIQSQIIQLSTQKTAIQEAYKLYQGSVSEKQNLETEINRLREDLTRVDSEIEVSTKNLQEYQDELARWQKVGDAFKILPKVHLQSFIEEIETVCSLIVTQFGYKGLVIDSDEDSKGIDFRLQDCGSNEDDVVETSYTMCSSFEKNLINLSLVYTLSRLFRVPFICIDELDSNADDVNTLRLGALIELILKYTTVVTVSHDSNLVSDLLQKSYKIAILKTEDRRERLVE